MQEHEQFGRPPNLRPRSAGVARASPRSVPVEQLAREANSLHVDAAATLSERLRMPRPGSASSRAHFSPRLAVAAPVPVASGTHHGMEMELKPTVLLSKPPMRPRSALMGSRGIVSQHRKELLQYQSASVTTATTSPSNQATNETVGAAVHIPVSPAQSLASQLQRVMHKTTEKEDAVAPRPSSASVRAVAPTRPTSTDVMTTRLPLKRPFSAAPSIKSAELVSVVPGIPNPVVNSVQVSTSSATVAPAPRAKRPFSAAAAIRGGSPRTNGLQFKTDAGGSHGIVALSEKAPPSRAQPIGLSANAMAIMASYHRDTFAYAVPRHCVEHGRQYNPYDIVTVSHDTLFGTNLSARTKREARFDYYTVSSSGMTFYCKEDDFLPSFDSSTEWEHQKTKFDKICKLPTFQLFRYRKAFLGWKRWIRSTKFEFARTVLLSSLYFSQPVLNAGMKEVQRELLKLHAINLMVDFEGSIHHLSVFAAKSSDHVQRQGFEILKITGQIQQILVNVCHECLNSTESAYGGFPGHEFALSTRKSSNFHIFEAFVERERALATANHQLVQHQHFQMGHSDAQQPSKVSLSMAAQFRTTHRKYIERVLRAQQQRPQDALDEIRWTMAAIQRRRCVLLTKFVALVDFMALDALHSVLTRSFQLLRDYLWVGANAGSISRLLDRQDYVFAFHQTLETRQSGTNPPTADVKSKPQRKIELNKQQTKRFLRAAWEPKLAALVRSASSDGSSGGPQNDDDADSSQHVRSSTTVWLESRLEAFFMQALTQLCGSSAESFGIHELMHVVENTMAQALVLPDFRVQQCSIQELKLNADGDNQHEGFGSGSTSDIQRIEALAPVALFHISMVLQVDETSKKCSILFKPTLDRVFLLIKETVSSFVELFQGIPSVVLHQELRAILEFAEDFRAASITRGDGNQDSGEPANNAANAEDEEEESRWNKSNYDRLFFRVGTDQSCSMLHQNIDELTNSAIDGAVAFAGRYDELLATYTRNENVKFDGFRVRFRKGQYSLKEMEADVTGFAAQIEELRLLKETQTIEFLQFDMSKLKEALLPSPEHCLRELHGLFPLLALEKCQAFLAFVRNSCKKIEKPTIGADVEKFARYLLHLRDVQDDAEEKEDDLTFIHDLFRMLTRLEIEISAEILESFDLCDPEFDALKAQLNEALAKREADIHERSPLLTADVKKLMTGIETLKTNSTNQTMNSGDSVSHDARDLANTLEKEAEVLSERSTQLLWVQRVFCEFSHSSRPPPEEFTDLAIVSNELKLKNELWEAVADAEEYLTTKQDETLRDIDLGHLRDILTKVDAVIKRLQQKAVQIGAVKRLENCKSVLEGLTPVIRDLRNENLEERHWTKLEHKMKCSFVRQVQVIAEAKTSDEGGCEDDAECESEATMKEVKFLDLPLRHLLEIEAVNHAAMIHQVSEEATAEAAITKSFVSVAQTWETREIPSQAKKDREGRDAIYLGDCTELMTLIEESEVLLRVMESSTFARVIHARLSKLLQDLAYAKETMELLVVCHQKWEYLQRLVSADFVRLFPEQGKALQVHDANWKGIMETVLKRPLCLPFGINAEYRQTLQATLQGFEYAAKHLEQHLELKRQAFPAFFKLSNTELATLLSKVRDVNNIQQFLCQCFDNVARINFGTREACQDVLSITSRAFPQAETISMGKNLKARGPPEQWLVSVEKRLVEMLRKGTKEAVVMLSQGPVANTNALDGAALQALPLQCILLADRILRSELIDSLLGEAHDEAFFTPASLDRIYSRLRQFHTNVMEQVGGTSEDDWTVVRSPREIVLQSCLRLHEIEFRDVVAEHILSVRAGNIIEGSSGGLGIQWQLQLKHRFDDSTTVGYDCHVEMDGARVAYGFNYVNPNAELIFTPRSLRFVFSIFAATRHAQTALLTGPAQSGKQSLAVHISRLFGRRFFGTNVSQPTGGSSMFFQVAHCLRLVRGALQVGGVMCIAVQQCWECIDLLRVLSATVSRIEYSVLCKLPITGLQKDPISWVPGTTLLLTCRLLPSSSPLWENMQYKFDIAAASFSRIAVMAEHDLSLILEALIYAKCLEAPRRTAQRLAVLWRHLTALDWHDEVSEIFSLGGAKKVIAMAAQDARKNAESFERENLQSFLICEAVLRVIRPWTLKIGVEKGERLTTRVMETLDEVFQYQQHQQEWYTRQWKRQQRSKDDVEFKRCTELVEEAAQDLHFVPRRQLAIKSIELARGLSTNVGVIMAGPSGVGKTTTYSVLASALDQWKRDLLAESHALKSSTEAADARTSASQHTVSDASSMGSTQGSKTESAVGPFVSVHVVLPMALTLDQLYGSTSNDPKGQIKSVIGRLVRSAQESYALSTEHEIQHTIESRSSVPGLAPILAMQKLTWVVVDGGAVCGGLWLDILLSILTRKNVFGLLDCCENPSRQLLRFMDGEFMTIPPNLRFIFESWSLDNATPAMLQHCALVVFPAESEAIHINRDEEVDALPIHFACIQRFLEQQRLAATAPSANDMSAKLSTVVYDTVTNRLLGTEILAKISGVMNDYGVTVHLTLLQRVEYMLSLLQALLNTVAVTCSSSRKPQDTATTTTSVVIPEEDVQHRVDMAIVYSLLWGFSACCASGEEDTRYRALQLLISGMIKTHFEEIAHSWEDCGRDANLFELLLDINGLRFVSLESGDTVTLRDKIWRHTLSTWSGASPTGDQHLHSLFIPTQSSLIVHAAMKEAIRSARGVLLVGSDTSRKTTLLQNFLKQLEPLRILTTSSYASIPPPVQVNTSDLSDSKTRRKRAVPLLKGLVFPKAENAFASLDRIRLHQVGLVKRLAKRFRKVNKAAAAAAALAAAQRYGSSRIKSGDNAGQGEGQEGDKKSKSTKKDQEWLLHPHLSEAKSTMISKFDLGDVIPFYFAMNQHDRGVRELAKCLERMLQRERSGIYEPPPGKAAVLIIDDLHLPVATHDEEHPSCHAFLRSAYEHETVLSTHVDTAGATPIKIENLMMVASIETRALLAGKTNASASKDSTPITTRHYALDKLAKQFLPVYAPPCSPLELHTIFNTLVIAQWESVSTSPLDKLTPIVRQIVPVVIAATTVLWEKLRRRWRVSAMRKPRTATKFDLHVLKRVYTGLCAVEPSYILDTETMARLWAHESGRSFGDLPAPAPNWREHLKVDVFRVRILLDGLDHQHLQRGNTNATTATIGSPAAATKVTSTIGSTALTSGGDATRVTNLSSGMNATGYLSFFATELLAADTARKAGDLGISVQQRAAYERKKLHVVAVWAFVPSSLYYQSSASDTGGSPQTAGGSTALASPLQRRNSIRFIRRKSLENVIDDAMAADARRMPQNSSKATSLGNARWIYAELPSLLEAGSEAKTDELTSVQGVQSVFSGIRIFGASAGDSMSLKPVTDLLLQMHVAQLPRAAPVITPLTARNIAQLERVVTPQGSRVVLVAPPGSGREVLLRYTCAVRQTSQPQSIWTVEGVSDETSADLMAKKWKHVVQQLFLRVGVEFESVTLVVKRLTLWPEGLINQLIALIVSGEIPGAFSLDEQIKLATRVRDERLIELEQRYQSQIVRIRQEIELQQDEEILARKDSGEAAALTGQRKAVYHQEMERKYQHLLLLRLSQVQVRHQQELDDFLRKCEVENESVTATIMSLMRPLGMTSGKWQQIVQRVRKRLKIVVLVDTDEYPAIIKIAPQLFQVCSIATLSSLDLPSLQTALYGSFRVEVGSVFRKERQRAVGGRSTNGRSSVDEQTDLVRFFDRVEHELPKITEVAAEIHSCAKAHASLENRKLPTELGVVLARFFSKFVWYRYQCERDERAKAEWFSYVYKSMEQALWKLQDRDGELRAQLSSCDQQIEISQELLVEQKEDCDRIRDMMKRYQDAAEEQVQVTNEMEMRAQAELHVPMACLEEANAALLMIDKRHIIEIKSFNSPPLLVHFVLDAICVMFQLEPAWENARRILSDANVVHTLLTFDKDNISAEILTKLETTYICDPRFHREEVEKQSVAASMMVVWVRAIYQYATARREVMPTLEKLEQAQSRLKLLMQEYQVSKQRVVEAGDALAKTKETLEKAIEVRKETVDEMESRKTRLDGGRVLLQFLGDDKSEAEKAFQHLERERGLGLTWWNALLDAGSLTYGSYFDASDRVGLFIEWTKVVRRAVSATITGRCEDLAQEFVPSVSLKVKEQQVDSMTNEAESTVAVETESSATVPETDPRDPIALFSTDHKYWEFASACGYLFSERNLQDAFLLTQTALAGFPVVLVTEYSSEMEVLLVNCARYIWKWSQFLMVSAKASDLETTVTSAIQEGHQLLILDVDPLDIEYKLGNLWWLYHWNQSSSSPTTETDASNESTEYLCIPPSTFAETPAEDVATTRSIAVHPSFRAIFTTPKHGAAFGDTLLTRVPVISAQLHTSDIPDIILDKLWHPGLFEGGQHGFGLKQSVREFERLCRQSDDAQTNLTKLIQGAAVRGQFQREETDLIRVACSKTKEIRASLVQTRQEIHERMKAVQNVQTLSRLGAALFSSINNGPEPRVSLQLFLPMFMAVLKKPTPALTTSPTSMMRQPSSSSSPLRSLGRATNFGSQQQGSTRTLLTTPAKGNGFDSISEIMKKMLEQLMPLVRDVSEWYEFLVHMLWLLERQYTPERSPPNAAAQEAAMKTLGTASSERRVRRLLSTMKIGHWKSQAVCEDYLALPPFADSIMELLVPLVVSGHSSAMGAAAPTDTTTEDADGINNALAAVFAASRCRAERVKTAVSMYPFLVRPLCDRILQAYGVQVRFAPSDVNDVIAALPSSASPSRNSSIRQLSTVSQGMIEESTYSAFNENSVKAGWLRMIESLPRTAVVLLRSDNGFGSFAFLSRVFQATTASDATSLQVLKLVTCRNFRTSLEAEELFILPNPRLEPGGHADRSARILMSTLSDATENALMILNSKTLLQMNRDKLESFLDDVPLTIVNLHKRHGDPAKVVTLWEDLYHMIQHTPERTTSTELRRHESSSAPSNTGARAKSASDTPDTGTASAGGAISLISPGRGPTARRFSTQNAQHRRSDAGTTLHNAMTALPPFLSVVDDTNTIPDHLRNSMVAFASEATELGSDCMPSLKYSLQETLARVAYHPCSELIRQCLPSTDSESGSKTQAASTGNGSAAEANQDADSMARLLWHYLTALAVFHAILRYRWKVSLRQYASSSSWNSPIESYSWDVLTTALDQLFQALVQLRAGSKSSSLQLTNSQMEALLIRVKQQVFLSSYTRQATTARELIVLRTLSRECLCLVQDSTTSVVDMSALLAPGISNSRSTRSHRNLQVANSSRMIHPPGMTPTAPGGYNASSRKIIARRSSLGDGIGSLVSGLNLPLDVLRTSVKDTSSWIEFMWSYTTQIDGAIEKLARDLFGLLPPCDLQLVSHPAASVASECWSELFGWIKQPTRYGSLASQLALDDALQCLELIHEKIIPATIEDNERSLQTVGDVPLTAAAASVSDSLVDVDGEQDEFTIEEADTPSASRSSLGSVAESESDRVSTMAKEDAEGKAVTAFVPNARRLLEQCIQSFIASYNRHIQVLRSTLEETIDELKSWRDHTRDYSSTQRQMLESVGDPDTRATVLAILCNRVPIKLRQRASASPTYLMSSGELTLDALITHYQRWYKNLEAQHQSLRGDTSTTPCQWWLPGVPAQTSINHLIHVARLPLAHKWGISSEQLDLQYEMVFTLRVDAVDSSTQDTASGDDPVGKQSPESVVVVFSGLELRLASWDGERGYLQTLDRLNSRAPQPVSVVCRLEKRAALTTQDALASGSSSQPLQAKKPGVNTRSCPLVTRNGVAYEFHLPVGPAFGSMVQPYLTLVVP